MNVAGLVATTGDPVALSVVKVLSLPALVPAVFVAIWIIAVTLSMTSLTTWAAYVTGISTVISNVRGHAAGAAAIHELVNFLPVQLSVDLTCSYIFLNFTIAKAAALASAASRWLWGR